MLRELAFREPLDPRYDATKVETSSDLEALIAKIRMILYTNQGEILGEPELGLNLESFLFDFDINENLIRERFYSQISKYITERQFMIDIDFKRSDDETQKYLTILININGQPALGVISSG